MFRKKNYIFAYNSPQSTGIYRPKLSPLIEFLINLEAHYLSLLSIKYFFLTHTLISTETL